MEAQQETLTLLYPEDTIRRYFGRGADRHLAQFTRSIANANDFLREHPREALTAGKGRPDGLTRALQYYKDETFLTLWAFISLDLAAKPEHLKERERLCTQLLRQALPNLGITVTAPKLELEKLVVPPKKYLEVLAQSFRDEPDSCHPVWYLRVLGAGNSSLEGNTHSDAFLTYNGDRHVLFEAKFLSDISASTTYGPERNQLTRNLDAGLANAGFALERFAYVFITPQRFRDRPESRFYGYKLSEYMDAEKGPSALKRDLPHLERLVDYADLAQHIGWVTWEEIVALLAASPVFCSPEFPHAEVHDFFRERCI